MKKTGIEAVEQQARCLRGYLGIYASDLSRFQETQGTFQFSEQSNHVYLCFQY